MGIVKDCFYSSMREAHFYDASYFAYLDKMWAEFAADPTAPQKPLNTAEPDADVVPTASICIGVAYNANINRIVAGQVYNGPLPATGRQAGQPIGKRLNIIKSLYTKFELKIPALINDFCTYIPVIYSRSLPPR